MMESIRFRERWSDRSYTALNPVTPSLALHYSHATNCNVATLIYVGKYLSILVEDW